METVDHDMKRGMGALGLLRASCDTWEEFAAELSRTMTRDQLARLACRQHAVIARLNPDWLKQAMEYVLDLGKSK